LIDTIAVTPNIIECIKGYKLLEVNDIIITDYHTYLVDINFEKYFQAQLSSWDNINRRIIDSVCRSYRTEFCKIVEDQMEIFNL